MASTSKLAGAQRLDFRPAPRTLPSDGRALLTPEDVARLVGLSVETLAQWRSQRRGIPFIKISRNCVRYQQADLDAWLTERKVGVQQDPSIARR